VTARLFLEIDGVEGDSPNEHHSGKIELLNWSLGMNAPEWHGAGITRKIAFTDLVFTHRVDLTSPLFMQVCAEGRRLSRWRCLPGVTGTISTSSDTLENVGVLLKPPSFS
jgi:type VI protein secretion system component Hcp